MKTKIRNWGIAAIVVLLGGCGVGTNTEKDPYSGLAVSATAKACTYTPSAGRPKQCSNVDAKYCTKYSYGSVGDETPSTYAKCSDLGF
jgi:hypothetical protein